MKAKITKRLVDDVTATDKPVVVFDTEVAGFCLRVMPSGSKSYQLRYRMGGRGSPLKTLTLGRHGGLTPDMARRQAVTMLGDIQRGIDPAAEKARKASEDRGALTVAVLSREFLEVYGVSHLKPRSLESYADAFRLHICPAIGGFKVKDVQPGDTERMLHQLRTVPVAANKAAAVLSKFFSWAIRAGYRPDRQNPCTGLQRFKEVKR